MKKLFFWFLFVASVSAQVPPNNWKPLQIDALGKVHPLTVNGYAPDLPPGSTVGGQAINSGGSMGGVQIVSVVAANGISGTVANATTTPAITLSLGAISPVSINGLAISGSGSFTSTGGSVSGANTGDQTTVSGNAGTATKLATARTIAMTGPVTWSTTFDGSANVTATSALSTVNSNVGTFTNSTVTVGADGRITAISTGTGGGGGGTWGSITGTLSNQTDLSTALAGKQPLDSDLTYLATVTLLPDVKTILNAANFAAIRTSLGLTIGTNVQAFDADLTTYANITPSANLQTFLGSVDFAAMRTNLGLVIGTNVQAFDPDLNYLSTFTPTANVKSILNAASYAAIETQFGHGTIVSQNGTGTSTAPQGGNGTGGFSPLSSDQYFIFTEPGYDFIPWHQTGGMGTSWFTGKFDRDATLAGNDPNAVVGQQAVKSFVESKVVDTAYNATSWDADTTHAPSKNAVRDKIEALVVAGGTGTVTAVTAHDLSPLFTTTVGTGTTTPEITFTATNAAAHSVFANTTGGSGPAAFVSNTSYVADIGLAPANKPTFANVYYGVSSAVWNATTTIDFSGDAQKTVLLAGNTTFAASNLNIGRTKIIRITCDGTPRTLGFNVSWTFITPVPSSIAAGKIAVLTLMSWTALDTGVIAAYQVQP